MHVHTVVSIATAALSSVTTPHAQALGLACTRALARHKHRSEPDALPSTTQCYTTQCGNADCSYISALPAASACSKMHHNSLLKTCHGLSTLTANLKGIASSSVLLSSIHIYAYIVCKNTCTFLHSLTFLRIYSSSL